jgi:ABC-type phosphate transport system substrate-binding protein
MKTKQAIILLTFLAAAVTPSWGHHMAVVVDKRNTVRNISSERLARIFRHETEQWENGSNIVLVLQGTSHGEAETLQRLTRMSDSEMKAFVDAHKSALKFARSDADVLEVVASTPGAIGLVDVRSVNNRVNVVRVNGKLPLEEGYLPH